MSKTRCLIVDDEPVAQRIIENYLLDLKDYKIVGKCLNALTAREVLLSHQVDLLFLDLEMPKLKGFEFLKTLSGPPAVIITTAYREFALEGFEHNVLDYLLKPISFERFIRAIDKYHAHNEVVEKLGDNGKVGRFLIVRSERKTIKLLPENLLYIKGMNNYIQIFTIDSRHTVYSSLQNMMDQLDHRFMRVHRSYIVNRDKITAHTSEKIEIDEISIPLGITYRKGLRNGLI